MGTGGTMADDALDEMVSLFLGLIDAWAGLIETAATMVGGRPGLQPEPRRPYLELD